MEKFSLYDLLGLLLPGVLFVYFCTVLNTLFNVCPLGVATDGKNISIGILLCFALITGAMLYVVTFWLVNKVERYNRIFKMYKHVTDLYRELNTLHKLMNETLNRKATEWYGKKIYYSEDDFKSLTGIEKDQVKELQKEYYDRMYYELEYENKIENAKAFQSFYYFFRQLVTACLLLLALVVILQVMSLIPGFGLTQAKASIMYWLTGCLLLTFFLSARLARWYRKRMVSRMYWAYFTHLTLKK